MKSLCPDGFTNVLVETCKDNMTQTLCKQVQGTREDGERSSLLSLMNTEVNRG